MKFVQLIALFILVASAISRRTRSKKTKGVMHTVTWNGNFMYTDGSKIYFNNSNGQYETLNAASINRAGSSIQDRIVSACEAKCKETRKCNDLGNLVIGIYPTTKSPLKSGTISVGASLVNVAKIQMADVDMFCTPY